MSEKVKLECFEFGPYETNTFLLSNEDFENEYILIESPPDCFKDKKMIKFLKKKPKFHLILTHGHWDHVHDAHLFQKYGAEIYIHERDHKDWLAKDQVKPNMTIKKIETGEGKNVHLLKDGDVLNIIGLSIKIIHTPGHTMGSSCCYIKSLKKVFVGDTLFKRGVGRTDMEFGSWDHIKKSIANKLYTLPEETDVYPGHGEFTRIGDEKKNNSYL